MKPRNKTIWGIAILFASVSLTAEAGPGDGKGGPGDDFKKCELKLEKIGPKEMNVGQLFDYFIRIENKGHCSFEDLDLVDEAPERVKFVSAYPEPRKVTFIDGDEPNEFLDRVKWDVRSIEPRDVKIFHLRVHVVGPPRRTLENKACIRDGWDDRILDCDRLLTEVVTGGG